MKWTMEMDKLELATRAATACPPDIPQEVYDRRIFALVPTIIILVLSITTYLLRLYCRTKTAQKWGWDDYLMGIGLLISFEPAICEFILVANGLGHHICNLPKDMQARFALVSWALQRANQPALACIKISIVLFYMRIFHTREFRIAAYVVIGYTICWAISTWIVNLTVCTPIAYYYDRTIPGGSCRNQAISGSVAGGLSLLGDVAVLVLPVPLILGLKINTRRKLSLLGIFLLGCFVCVAAAIRIVELSRFVATDPSYSQVYASTWTTLEMGVAVISGNLPLLAPLFERFMRNRSTHYYYRSGDKPTAGGSGSGGGTRGEGASRLGRLGNKGHTLATVETIGSKSGGRNQQRSKGRDSLSDSDRSVQIHSSGQTPAESLADIEMDDRAILVKTQVRVESATMTASQAEKMGRRDLESGMSPPRHPQILHGQPRGGGFYNEGNMY